MPTEEAPTATGAPHGTPAADGQDPVPRGVPGAQRVDHVALTVPDLDDAIDFTVRGLGGELVYRLPPLAHDDDWMRVHLDTHPRASAEIALIRLGPTTNLELFAYQSPDHRATGPGANDAGNIRLALRVEDVPEAARALRQRTGAQPLGPVRTLPEDSPGAGTEWVLLTTPWGMPVELRSVPAALPYERHTSARRFDPAPSWSNREDGARAPHALPGARGLDHVAYTVADLDAAERFFVDVLGAEPVHRHTVDLGEPALAEAVGVPQGGSLDCLALRMGPTDTIELHGYRGASRGRPTPPRNSDVGGHHLAIHVSDVDAAASYLGAQPGCAVLGAPETIDEGPLTGDRWVYVRTSLGLYVEVVNMPDGTLPYERTTPARRRAAGAQRWWSR